MSFNLEIITPEQVIYNENIDLVIMPGIEGDFGILKNHLPFLTYLRLGLIYIYKEKKIIDSFLVNTGIVEVTNQSCVLLTEDIVKSKDYKSSEKNDEMDQLKTKILKKLYYA